ncbi:exodeoxyribonuclease VII large subunit [Geomicrobium sp. JCM 19037]|uniref:exodeoxyribonuclease VII large subunit n=1 Tax=Geomicrobium sp. JCM 19037 TaxID=1460634 RepID=UPI000A4526FE|nr:exodeoxyribonuclease VII large subunit [Geomicrobium sp. JCM 19037]
MKVLVQGNISVYEPYGQYQLYVRSMEPDGLGQLYLAYEQLKKKLETEGLFANERKKPLPSFPKRVGVVTSQTGAVIRDIYTTITRRYPQAAIHLYPVAVQGPEAVPSIVNALKRADAAGLDVLIAGAVAVQLKNFGRLMTNRSSEQQRCLQHRSYQRLATKQTSHFTIL